MSRRKIALFIRNGIIGNMALNKAVPVIIGLGYQPVLFNTGEPYSKRADTAELREIGFVETGILRDVLSPFAQEMGALTHNNTPIPNLCYTNKEIAKLYKLDYEAVENVNDTSFVSRIEADKDFIGSHSTRILQIFHEPLLSAFENRDRGFVWNTHTGLLPKYKGVHIPFHAIENGEEIYGWTLHRKFRGIDTGHILAIDWLPLAPKASVLSTYLNMVPKGTKMLKTVLAKYKRTGMTEEKPQPKSLSASYHTHPTSLQMQKYKRNGVYFATTEEVINTYLSAYSLPGTPHYAELEKRIRGAINERGVELVKKAVV